MDFGTCSAWSMASVGIPHRNHGRDRVAWVHNEGLNWGHRLAQLAPTVIITQDQCRVCAVSEPQLREAVDSWAAAVQVSEPTNPFGSRSPIWDLGMGTVSPDITGSNVLQAGLTWVWLIG